METTTTMQQAKIRVNIKRQLKAKAKELIDTKYNLTTQLRVDSFLTLTGQELIDGQWTTVQMPIDKALELSYSIAIKNNQNDAGKDTSCVIEELLQWLDDNPQLVKAYNYTLKEN